MTLNISKFNTNLSALSDVARFYLLPEMKQNIINHHALFQLFVSSPNTFKTQCYNTNITMAFNLHNWIEWQDAHCRLGCKLKQNPYPEKVNCLEGAWKKQRVADVLVDK